MRRYIIILLTIISLLLAGFGIFCMINGIYYKVIMPFVAGFLSINCGVLIFFLWVKIIYKEKDLFD